MYKHFRALLLSHKAVSQSVPDAQVQPLCQSVEMLVQLLLEQILLSISSGHLAADQHVNK
jgi:hypothetical protein